MANTSIRFRLIKQIIKGPPPGQKRMPVPEILKVLKAYRGKSSILFLIRWTLWDVPEEPPREFFSISGLIHKVGYWDDRKQQLWGIYQGLEKEIGTAKAMMAIVEILEKKINDRER